jgi:drug/metabolite transporter (DMT)-like permease
MGLPYLLFARGVSRVTGHEAAGIVLLEPILVPVWVYLAWRHVPSYQAPQWWTLAGGGLILLGLGLRYLGRKNPRVR